MAVSRLLPSGGANDFNLNITGPTTIATFDKEYSSGSYSIVSSGNDATIDIYAYNAAGNLVGYSGSKAFTASAGFNKMVILGGTVGDVLGFTYKKTITTTVATSEVTAGPVIYSTSPSFMANVNDTITVTGANFASNVTITFTGTGYDATAAKNVVRSSSTSLIVTRPDNFPVTGSPYTITASNPGVANPTGSAVNSLVNAITAGASPVFSTAAVLPKFTINLAYSQTIVATDVDAGTTVTLSVVSNTLPAGLTFNTTSGVISGTPTGTTAGGITVRATDTGGNFVDRAFTIANNAAPVWVTTSPLASSPWNTAYSVQLATTDDSGVAPVYSLVSGSLPTGITLNSTGLISGTTTVSGTFTPTVRATDANGGFTDRTFSIEFQPRYVQLLLIAGGGSGGNGVSNGGNVSGGGGAGGVLHNATVGVSGGTSYPIVIGAGGTAYTVSNSQDGYPGINSTALGLTAIGGGSGIGAGGSYFATENGGSGGGSGNNQGSGGAGTPGQGNNGGSSPPGGGGGAGSAGGVPTGGSGTSAYSTWANATGTGVSSGYAGGGGGGGSPSNNAGGGAGGGFGATNGGGSAQSTSSASANTGSGSGGAGTTGGTLTTGAGGSGICIIRYPGSQIGTGGSIVTTGGFTYHTFTSNGTFIA